MWTPPGRVRGGRHAGGTAALRLASKSPPCRAHGDRYAGGFPAVMTVADSNSLAAIGCKCAPAAGPRTRGRLSVMALAGCHWHVQVDP